MRLFILLFALWSIVTTTAAQAEAVEYGEINNPSTHLGERQCFADWINLDGSLGLDLYSEPELLNVTGTSAAADVIEFNPPVVLEAQPYLAFAVKYLAVSAKPFLRIQYEGTYSYQTVTLDNFREVALGNGFYYHILDKPVVNYGRVKRIAVIARSGLIAPHFFVGAFDVADMKITKLVGPAIYHPNGDPLLDFKYP
jgi:hypothetical protein